MAGFLRALGRCWFTLSRGDSFGDLGEFLGDCFTFGGALWEELFVDGSLEGALGVGVGAFGGGVGALGGGVGGNDSPDVEAGLSLSPRSS